MSANVKKVITWGVVAFVVFYLATDPRGSANVVDGALNLLQQAANSVVVFFQSLGN